VPSAAPLVLSALATGPGGDERGALETDSEASLGAAGPDQVHARARSPARQRPMAIVRGRTTTGMGNLRTGTRMSSASGRFNNRPASARTLAGSPQEPSKFRPAGGVGGGIPGHEPLSVSPTTVPSVSSAYS
jgi:hypothetical protein